MKKKILIAIITLTNLSLGVTAGYFTYRKHQKNKETKKTLPQVKKDDKKEITEEKEEEELSPWIASWTGVSLLGILFIVIYCVTVTIYNLKQVKKSNHLLLGSIETIKDFIKKYQNEKNLKNEFSEDCNKVNVSIHYLENYSATPDIDIDKDNFSLGKNKNIFFVINALFLSFLTVFKTKKDYLKRFLNALKIVLVATIYLLIFNFCYRQSKCFKKAIDFCERKKRERIFKEISSFEDLKKNALKIAKGK